MRTLIISLAAAAFSTITASAQVDTSGLVSEAPGSPNRCYIVSANGYYLTTKGSNILTTTIAPDVAEWNISRSGNGYTIKCGAKSLNWAEGGAGIALTDNTKVWDINTEHTFREGTYSIASDIVQEFYGTTFEDYDCIYISAEDGSLYPWPASYSTNPEETTADMLFFSTLPEQIDNRESGGGEEDKDEEIDVPENNIEGDFSANWELGMQDAKVLTYIPMDKTLVHNDYWMPVRKGVTKTEFTIFTEDVVSMFYGNKIKNLWLAIPANARVVELFVRDALEQDPEKRVLWSQTFDYSEAVNYILSQKNGMIDDEYGKSLNLSLLNGTSYEYYESDVIKAFPCDLEISSEHRNLEIGYKITYPGEYKENYKNGKNEKGGLEDGIWFSTSTLLPTSREYYALIKGDDDPDFYDGSYEDYTGHMSILLPQYRWADYCGLFCFVETEGAGGFPHNDLRFDDVKVSRCYTGDAKVPIKATFTNYGVDPILSANFEVTIGDVTRTLKFKDGIKFLEKGNLDDDLTPPSTALRQPMKILISKINGKEVNIASAIDGTVVSIDARDDVYRMPVVEENTGTWCGWCPRGIVGMEKLREKYEDDIALIAIHTGADTKANGIMDAVVGYYGATGAPSCIINRLRTGDPYNGTNGQRYGILNDVEDMRTLITEASIDIVEATINEQTHQVALTTDVEFAFDCTTCPYQLTYVITEDGLRYSTQANYYVTQTSADETAYYKENMPELYELTQKPNPWMPVYNDVMEYCDDPFGIEGSLKAPIVKGEKQNHNIVINIPNYTNGKSLVTDLKNCRAIVLLIDTESTEIVNAAQVKLSDAKVTTENLNEGLNTVLSETHSEENYDLFGRRLINSSKNCFNKASLPHIENGRKVIR